MPSGSPGGFSFLYSPLYQAARSSLEYSVGVQGGATQPFFALPQLNGRKKELACVARFLFGARGATIGAEARLSKTPRGLSGSRVVPLPLGQVTRAQHANRAWGVRRSPHLRVADRETTVREATWLPRAVRHDFPPDSRSRAYQHEPGRPDGRANQSDSHAPVLHARDEPGVARRPRCLRIASKLRRQCRKRRARARQGTLSAFGPLTGVTKCHPRARFDTVFH